MIPLFLILIFVLPGETTVVKPGETLWNISTRALGSGHRWTEIAELNGISKPYTVKPGQVLRLAPLADTDLAGVTVEPHVTLVETDFRIVPPRAWTPLSAARPTFPLTLAAALRTALDRHLPLLSARLDPGTARTALDIARADFDPVVSVEADHTWAKTATGATIAESERTTYSTTLSQALPIGTNVEVTAGGTRSWPSTSFPRTNRTHTADLALSVTQPLLEGAGRVAYADVDEARKNLTASERRSLRVAVEVASDIEVAYWTLAQAEEAEAIAAASLQVAENVLERNIELLNLGIIPQIEVLTARSGVATRRETLLLAVTTRENAARALLFSVYGEGAGMMDSVPTTSTEPFSLPVPESEGILEQRAINRRDDLVAAKAELEAAGIRVGATRNALLPQLDLTGTIGTGGTDGKLSGAWNDLGRSEEPTWTAGVVLTVPIGNRADRARHKAARITEEQRRLTLIQTENDIRQDVREARLKVIESVARLEIATENRQIAEERLVAEQNRLELGLGDTFRLLDVEQQVAQAFLAEVRAKHDLAIAHARLAAAVGDNIRVTG